MVTFYRLGASQLIVTQIFAVVFFGFPHGHVNGYDLYEGSPCKLTDGTPGVCTIIDQCMSVYQGLVSNTLPYAEVMKNRCGFVKDKEVVCCKDRQPDPPIGTTPRVTTPTIGEYPVNEYSGKWGSSRNDEWPSVRRPQAILNNRNVENFQDPNSYSGVEENDDKISSRFFLGNLLPAQNRENTFQNPQMQQQPMNVRCFNYDPTITTPPPVQIAPRIFGIFNFNKPARTTARPSILSPVLDVLRPIKEIPLNFISSIGIRRDGINMQGQSPTFGNTNELCVDNNGLIQGFQNTNNFESPNSINIHQGQNPSQNYNQDIWNNPSSPLPVSTSFMPSYSMNGNQPMIPMQSPNSNPNQNMWNIPSSFVPAPFTPSNSMNGNQPMIPMQSPNSNPNQNMWNIPSSFVPTPFTPSNSMNGNQPIETFQPVPMPNPSFSGNQNQNLPMSVSFANNGFRATTVKTIIENNQNWETNKHSPLEPWMAEVLRTTTIPSTTSTIRTPKIIASQLEPWMLDALKDSNSIVSNQPDNNNNLKPWTVQPDNKSESLQMPPSSDFDPWMLDALKDSNGTSSSQPDNRNPNAWTAQPNTKSEPLQMPASSEFDPWMLEVIKEYSSSTPDPNNPDQSKKDTPIIPLIKNENTTTSFGDSILDPWMKEALSANVNATLTTPLEPQNNRFNNSSSLSNTEKNAGFEPWMLEALRETNLSSSSSDGINRSKNDFPNIESLRNFDIETTTKRTVFGESVLDPWMKEALLIADESKSMTTSTPGTTETSALNEQIPPIPTSRETTNENNTFDPWMLDALKGLTSTKPTLGAFTKTSSQRPFDDTQLHAWMKEAIAGEENSSDSELNIEGAESSKRAVDSWRDHFHNNRTHTRDPGNPKSFSNSSNPSLILPSEEEWIWERRFVANNTNSSQSNKTIEDDVNYWMGEALKQKTRPINDKNASNPHQSLQESTNSNSQNNQLGRENLGVGKTIPKQRNGTDSINSDLFNEIFDIPENRPTKPIGPRNSRRSDDACAKYRDDFGAAVTYHILGGIAAKVGEFPHMAALGYPSTAANREFDWNCGASLISDQYLLTSAHCITREGPTMARLGKVSIDTDEDDAIAADFLIDESIKHPTYTNARQYHDIALIRLNRKVEYTENIRPACLDTSQTPMPPNTNVIVTGWGTISLRTRSRSDVLLKANLTTVTLSSCNQSHAEYEHNRKLPNGLTEAQMCAYDPELVKDACEGDSGGPLQIVDDSGMSTIYGVTSFGVSCASKIPGVYARVSNYVDWIESIVWP